MACLKLVEPAKAHDVDVLATGGYHTMVVIADFLSESEPSAPLMEGSIEELLSADLDVVDDFVLRIDDSR